MTSEYDGRPPETVSEEPTDETPPDAAVAADDLDPTGAPRRIADFGRPADSAARSPAARLPGRRTPAPPPAGVVLPVESAAEAAWHESYDESPLRNPYVIAAVAVAAAIVLAVLVVVASGGRGGGSSGADRGVVVNPLTPAAGQGLRVRSVSAATLRSGPGLDYDALGELPRNQEVEVVGRSADGRWYRIYYPPGSSLQAWVGQTALNINPDRAAALPVVDVTPIPRPTVIQPTSTPLPATQTPTTTPTGSPSPVPGPDVAIGILGNNCQPNVNLVVTIANAGQVALQNRQVRVTVSTAAGVQSLIDTAVSLEPGGVVNVGTSFVLRERTTVTVDLIGAPADVNPANNTAVCAVSTLPPTPTSTPAPGVVTPPPIPTLAPTSTPAP